MGASRSSTSTASDADSQLQLRRDELERSEQDLAELRERLDRREQELNAYVAQLQSGLVSN